MKKTLVIFDGGADLPSPMLGGKTPFEAAKTPNLDFFTQNGKMGAMYPIDEKTVPGSDNSMLNILGNNPENSKRGVLEAEGAGLKVGKNDLALRANFGTIESLKSKRVIDRRAGRTLTTNEANVLMTDINKIDIGVDFEFKSTVQHRGVLVLRNGNFSEKVSNVDNEWSKTRGGEFNYSKSLDGKKDSETTSAIINRFVEQTFKLLNNHQINEKRKKMGLLPANMIFLRGAGNKINKLRKYNNWMSINSMPLEIGISKLSGMKVFSFDLPKMNDMDVYENLRKSLRDTIDFSIKTLKREENNFIGCYVHFKETDTPGHDNKPLEKKRFIEMIDRGFFGFLRKFLLGKGIKLIVSCDHSTPCRLKAHSYHMVPVLVWGDGIDSTSRFVEKESYKGKMGKFLGKDFGKKTGIYK